jgi:hypothetical protein
MRRAGVLGGGLGTDRKYVRWRPPELIVIGPVGTGCGAEHGLEAAGAAPWVATSLHPAARATRASASALRANFRTAGEPTPTRAGKLRAAAGSLSGSPAALLGFV